MRTLVHSSLVGQTWSGVGLARAHDRAVGGLGDALDRRDRALERLDDLGHRDLARRAGRAGSRRASRAGSRPGRPCAGAPRGAPGRPAAARRWRRSPPAAPARSPALRASSTITRTPYSALVENIIAGFPTCELGYQPPSGPPRWSLRMSWASASGVSCSGRTPPARDLLASSSLTSAAAAKAAEPARARRHPVVRARSGAAAAAARQVERPPGERHLAQEALHRGRRAGGGAGVDDHDSNRAGEVVQRAPDLLGDQHAARPAAGVQEGEHDRAPAQAVQRHGPAVLVAQREVRRRSRERAARRRRSQRRPSRPPPARRSARRSPSRLRR